MSTEHTVEFAYPHADERCRQDSVDADGFREAARQVARLGTALGLGDTGLSISEVVDAAISRVAVPQPSSVRLCYRHRRADDWNVPDGEYDAPVRLDPALEKRGVCNVIRFPGHASTEIVLREWNEQVLLHEVLHALVGDVVPSEGQPDDLNHRIVALVEVGLTLAGWRFWPSGNRTPPTPTGGDQ